MTPSAKLGGFKILKDVVRISLVSSEQRTNFPAQLCRTIAEEKINLPYITCVNDAHSWGLNIMVESFNGARLSQLIEETLGKIFTHNSQSAILSIFPHKRNPEITGSLFEAFSEGGVEPYALANSPSAISVVLEEGSLSKASDALFGPFSFSAYRTPADWKLAQKGKEQLYKEVVASYQEKKPKVYGLEQQEEQEFLQIKLNSGHIGQVGTALKEFARLGLNLTFLATSPCQEEGREKLFLCLPRSEGHSHTEIIYGIAPQVEIETVSPVATFSMNGPHFGDRYGIASELLHALNKSDVDLLALNCTIASIIGVVPSHQIEPAIQAIQGCFEVPTVTKKEN
ncbi:MAG: hypothetical protein JSW15_02035 [Deltaproteobacteria bacterium]|nr:MAG: hypothetical protein JSW15_02035 [Deltaproteobacteria bacterium]